MKYFTKNFKKFDFAYSIIRNDVIHDALILYIIYNKKFKRQRKFGDVGSYGNMGNVKNWA